MFNKEATSLAIDRLNEKLAKYASDINPDGIKVVLRQHTADESKLPTSQAYRPLVTAECSFQIHIGVSSDDPITTPKHSKY